jgi:AraC family transcriptional regulator
MLRARSDYDVSASNKGSSSMNPAQKALWFIEGHLVDALSLDEIADVAGVSRFHMVRAFGAATGLSVMRYVRARRLSEAARALAAGAPDILDLALAADYGSHEAFTRAFRDHFGTTPEMVRASACLDHLKLQEPIQMDSTLTDNLQPPRFVTGKPLLIAGLGERISQDNGAGIPGQWRRFHPKMADIPDRVGRWPTASAATATIPETSIISPASRYPTSPTCRVNSRACGFPNRNTRSSPIATTSRPSAAPSTRSGISGCRHRD